MFGSAATLFKVTRYPWSENLIVLHECVAENEQFEGNDVSTTSRVAGGSDPKPDCSAKPDSLDFIAAPSTTHPLPRGGTDLIASQ